MKSKINSIKKNNFIVALVCFIAGGIIVFAFTRVEINTNKELTKRILNNSIQSLTASKEIADTCAEAYNTATACVANLSTCNIEEESKKLDEFNYRRGQAEVIIDFVGEDMQKVIQDVSANR